MKTRVEKLKNHAKSVSYLLSYRKYGQILPLFSDRFLSSKLTARLGLVLHVFSKLLVVFIIFFTSFIILKQQAKTKRSVGCKTCPQSTAIYLTVEDDYRISLQIQPPLLAPCPQKTDLATEREHHLTTGKHAERTKLDFRYPICRSAMCQSSCLICARSCQQKFPFCC